MSFHTNILLRLFVTYENLMFSTLEEKEEEEKGNEMGSRKSLQGEQE